MKNKDLVKLIEKEHGTSLGFLSSLICYVIFLTSDVVIHVIFFGLIGFIIFICSFIEYNKLKKLRSDLIE